MGKPDQTRKAIYTEYEMLLSAYLSKVGTPGTLEYREIFLIYREIFEKCNFFKNFGREPKKPET